MCHNLNKNDTADYYFNEIKAYYDMGCDGVKILDGKPDSYRTIGRRLNDKFYAFCEEMQIPVTMHLGDPANFWVQR